MKWLLPRFLNGLRGWIWPPICQLCGGNGLGPDVCRGCVRDLPRHGAACLRCAVPLPVHGVCGDCITTPPIFDRAVAPFSYSFPIDRLIQRLKYDGRLEHGRLMGELLGHKLRNRTGQSEAIVPVPLHGRRWRQRGFNQAAEISRSVSRMTGLPVLSRICMRVQNTPPLWPLSVRDRRRVLKSAFEVTNPLPVQGVAILDDVLTTGSTANALAKALKSAGARHVEVWAIARASGSRSRSRAAGQARAKVSLRRTPQNTASPK